MQTRSLFPLSESLLVGAAAWCLLTVRVQADSYLSNLGNLWPGGGVGDIHGVFRGGTPYGSYTAHFATGAGYFAVDDVTLEFFSSLDSARQLSVQIFEQTGSGSLLLGGFANPVIDSSPTQWPAYTTYIVFFPTNKISLNPFSQYSLVLSMPASSPVDAALLFSKSYAYDSPAGWTMRPTTSGNPYALGEYLKLRVDATQVLPDTTPPTIAISANPDVLWPPNGRMVPITISGIIADNEPGGTGVDAKSVDYAVADEYGLVQTADGVSLLPDGSYSFVVYLQAFRHGNDGNGRQYLITVTAQDQAGNTGSATATVIVPHDQRNKAPRKPVPAPFHGTERRAIDRGPET